MTAKEKLDLIKANPGCWFYSKSNVIDNTFSFVNYCKNRNNFTMVAYKYMRNSCSTYFQHYYYRFLQEENYLDSYYLYDRYDNEDIEHILQHIENIDIVLIERADHQTLWTEKEVDGKVMVGRFLFSENYLKEILEQQSLYESQFGEEPTSIRLNGRMYSKEELESMLDQLDSLKSILKQ